MYHIHYALFGIIFVLRNGNCFERYQFDIPNGFNVPIPCDDDGIWSGVGHLGPEGQGPRNRFGEDFQAVRGNWTRLCPIDSDKDGLTNGQELGDPECRWTKDKPTPLSTVVSHPGACEPWNATICRRQNASLICKDHQQCAAEYPTHVRQFSARLPLTLVPTKEFTYACMVFNIPTEYNYHMTEAKPIFYNRRVLHHMTLFACDSAYTVRVSGKPFECPKVTTAPCQRIIASYTPNFPITCLHDNVGILFGKDGIKQVVLQVLWKNPSVFEYQDSSGMAMYLTRQLRNHTIGFATLDATVFKIPPATDYFPVRGGCTDDCTSVSIKKPVYITMAINFMHKLGRKQRVLLIRNGTVINEVTRSEQYDYTKPDVFRHMKPLEVRPGDSLQMTCEYNSTGLTKPVIRGLTPDKEICRAQLMYYPKDNWVSPTCLGFKNIPLCKFETTGQAFNCNYQKFVDSISNDTRYSMLGTCSTTRQCSPECLNFVSQMREHDCLRGDMYELWKSDLISKPDKRLVRLYKALIPCEYSYERYEYPIHNRNNRGSGMGVWP